MPRNVPETWLRRVGHPALFSSHAWRRPRASTARDHLAQRRRSRNGPAWLPRSLVAPLNPRGAALIESSVERSVVQQSRGRLVGGLGPSQGKRRLTLSRTYHGEDGAR